MKSVNKKIEGSEKAVKIVRCQFTGWDRTHHPECDNGDYLDYERVTTALTPKGEICAYGWQERTPSGGGGYNYKWIKKADLPPKTLLESEEV